MISYPALMTFSMKDLSGLVDVIMKSAQVQMAMQNLTRLSRYASFKTMPPPIDGPQATISLASKSPFSFARLSAKSITLLKSLIM
jgi:hypothetical protein